ncbi:hypothetical protein [Bacillus altitudinis]|nr:hypothetical protein [Bacillus altitudinis]
MISLFFSLVTGAEEWMMISAGLTFILAKVLGKVAGIFYSNQQPFAELNQVNLLIEKNDCFPRDHAPFLFFLFVWSFGFPQGR